MLENYAFDDYVPLNKNLARQIYAIFSAVCEWLWLNFAFTLAVDINIDRVYVSRVLSYIILYVFYSKGRLCLSVSFSIVRI